MTWVKIDDNLPQNAKLRQVSVAARWTYVSSICYAGCNRTDGFVPFGALALLDGNHKISVELVAVNLWEGAQGGWMIHDFLKHNRSKEKAESVSEGRRLAGSKGAANRWQIAKDTDGKTLANASQSDSKLFLSVSDLNSPSENSFSQSTDTDRQTDGKLPSRRKPIDEEFLTELQDENPTVNVRDIYTRAQNRNTWDGYKDKRAALRDRVKFALQEQRGRVNGNGRRSDPQDDPKLQELRRLGVIIE